MPALLPFKHLLRLYIPLTPDNSLSVRFKRLSTGDFLDITIANIVYSNGSHSFIADMNNITQNAFNHLAENDSFGVLMPYGIDFIVSALDSDDQYLCLHVRSYYDDIALVSMSGAYLDYLDEDYLSYEGAGSSSGGTVNATVDLSPVLNQFATVMDKLTLISSGLGFDASSYDGALITNFLGTLAQKIDSIDLQVPNDLAAQLQTVVQNLPTQSLSLDAKSLKGSFCKFGIGASVNIDGFDGVYTVVDASLCYLDSNALTIEYDLSKDGTPIKALQSKLTKAL